MDSQPRGTEAAFNSSSNRNANGVIENMATAQTAQASEAASTTQERINEIVQAAKTLIHEHDTWSEDPTTPEVPSQRVELAANILINTAASGDIPAPCRDLVVAITAFGEQWRAYENGRRLPGGLPTKALWDAYSDIVHALTVVQRPQKKRVESVAELRRQGLNNTQIARAYGRSAEINGTQVWSGPFFDQSGSVLSDLIEQEASEPQSVIPDGWVHPLDKSTVTEDIARLSERLQAIRDDQDTRPTEDPAQMLRDGALPGQVATVCGISIDEVYSIAEANQLAIDSRSAAEIYAAAARGEESKPAPESTQQPAPQSTESDGSDTTLIDKDELKSLVYSIADDNASMGAPDIVRMLRDSHGITATARQVAAFLRHRK
jgi:hypothetical protein